MLCYIKRKTFLCYLNIQNFGYALLHFIVSNLRGGFCYAILKYNLTRLWHRFKIENNHNERRNVYVKKFYMIIILTFLIYLPISFFKHNVLQYFFSMLKTVPPYYIQIHLKNTESYF